MSKWIIFVLVFAVLFFVCSAEAADFAGAKKGLPSLVMLSTPT